MKLVNTNKILSNVDIVDVVGKHLELTKSGANYITVCPFHNDKTASLKVNRDRQYYKCFACGKGGDAIDFLMSMGCTFHEAVKSINDDEGFALSPIQREKIETQKARWTQIMRPPYAPPKKIEHYILGKPSIFWRYTNADGSTIGYVCRFDLPDGGKEIAPFIFATDGNRSKWKWGGFANPRPLYNLHNVVKTNKVVLVEGEKAADAGNRLIPSATFSSWQGGGEAVHHIDFTPLKGKDVLLIPDNDKAGYKAMSQVYEIISPYVNKATFVDTLSKPHKWDIADEPDWDKNNAIDFIKSNIIHQICYPE
jgi:putative DNA primase/helicase